MTKSKGPLDKDITTQTIGGLLRTARRMGIPIGGHCSEKCPECKSPDATCGEGIHMPSTALKDIHKCRKCGHTWESK